LKKYKKFFLGILVWLILAIILVNFYVLNFSKNWYFKNIKNLPKTKYWLVFWASIKINKEPSDILKDRLIVAYKAYLNKKITKIIVSWDKSKYYDEPNSMKNFLIKLWIPKNDIIIDNKWKDTYSSLFIAKNNFKIKKIILFTQDFQLKRALYIWKKLWIDTYWVETNLHKYKKELYNNLREIWARIKAFIEVEIIKKI
jgi:SanA protein